MKKFEMPKIEVEKLNIADVITTSFECGDDCGAFAGCPNDTCLTD